MAGLFLVDKHGRVTRDEFHRFVQRSLQRFPMIQALEWVPLVDNSERDDFETEQRSELPTFAIRERNEDGKMVRANDRANFFPVTYVEPLAGNAAAVGFDLASNISRRTALYKALQSDAIVTTEAVHLVQDSQTQAGVLILSAITRHNMKSGIVLTVLRMGDFMDNLLSDTRSMLFVRLTDVDQQQVLFTDFTPQSGPVLNEQRFTFGTRHYLLETAPTPLYFKQHRSWQSFAVLSFGLLGTGLVGTLLLLGTGYTARVENQVEDRTKELTESESRFRFILENSPISVHIANHSGTNVVFANQSYADLIGLTPDHVIGINPRLYFANPHDYNEIIEQIRKGDYITNRLIALNIPGERPKTKWVLGSYLKLVYQNEPSILGWFFDITERKESEDQFRAVVEAAPNGMVMIDVKGIIVAINTQITAIFGYAEAELIGQSINTLLPQEFHHVHKAHIEGYMDKPTQRMMGGGRDLAGQHKDGRRVLVEIGLSPIQISGESYVLASVVDITERQHTLDKLRATTNQLEIANTQIEEERASLAERVAERTSQLQLANHAKDSFLATMSHEIRTPLGGMLGMMELLNLSSLNFEQRHQLKTAQLSGKSLLRIVNDILDWSKIEAGKLELSPHAASIAEMLNSVSSTYAQLAADKGITLKVSVDPKLSTQHIFDPLRLSQILINFTSNAIKFSEQGSVEISAQRLEGRNGYETVRFSVKDSGNGIDSEQQSRLFQRYEQATADTARMYGGTGLGLAICRRLAELMDGTLSVESTPGVGSIFYFTISLSVVAISTLIENVTPQTVAQAITHQDGGAEAPMTVDGRPLAMLIADDHPVNRMLLKQQLSILGVRVATAESGMPALQLWHNSHFDMIITDCHMPGMDGYELTRQIRAIEQQAGSSVHIPIIAWTANVLSDEIDRCQMAGMDDLLTKPTELAELRAMLHKWLVKSGDHRKILPNEDSL